MMDTLQKYIDVLNRELSEIQYPAVPDDLYAPIRYELSLGGKRIRPVLTLMAAEMFGGDYRPAMNAALGLEIFHNFTLLHDDVMDKADMRRGKPTVHKVWNENSAILSGDAMQILAFRYISATPVHTGRVIDLFLKTALEICEGQQLDMDFESRNDVSEEEYIEMIRLKTSVLLGGALKIGAIIGGASDEDADRLYRFGENIGLAFQLQDDYLDVYGDPAVFGKNIGGDILNDKKTYMLISARRLAQGDDARILEQWVGNPDADAEEKIAVVTGLYDRLGIKELCAEKIAAYFDKAMKCLSEVTMDAGLRQPLEELSARLMGRNH